jgi:hypothetical protein
MRFTKIDSQYHSVRREAKQAGNWVEAFGLQLDDFSPSATGASWYGSIMNDDEDDPAHSIRVSRHEPNYSLHGDAEIMLYVGASIFNGRHDTNAWWEFAEKLAELSGRSEWPACVKSFFTRRQNRLQDQQRAKETAQAAMYAATAQRRREWQERSIDRFISLCRDHRIDSSRAADLLTATPADLNCLAAQVQKWFTDSALPDIAAAAAVLEANQDAA